MTKNTSPLCKNCGQESFGKTYCCKQCGIDWNNKNRVLKPNVFTVCEVCGKSKSRWVSPSRIKEQGMPRFCSRTCAGKMRCGENHPNWIGEETTDKDGYVYLFRPDHPCANKSGKVFRHRIVMERFLGRLLEPSEVVHHKNDTPGDDRIENLFLYKNNADHKKEDYKNRKIGVDGRFLPKEDNSVNS